MCLLDQTRSAAADAALGQERSRIARELHDSLIKSLEGISLQAEAMVMSGKAVYEASMIKTAGQSIQESRQLLRDLRESSVPPLADSLARLVDDVAALHGVTVDLQVDGCLELPLDVRYAAYWISEEVHGNLTVKSKRGPGG